MPDFSYETLQPFRYNAQGMYTFDWEGTPYGGQNIQKPEAVLQLLAEAKQAFEANPPKSSYRQRSFDDPKPQRPPGTVIARKIARIRPFPVGASPRNKFVGRDYLWILPLELELLVRGKFPNSLAARLTRHHLTDNIRGVPDSWLEDHVRVADFLAQPQARGDIVRVKITGTFAMLAPAGRSKTQDLEETGYEGTLEGYLIYDQRRRTVLDLKWIAEGEHWGRSHHNPKEPSGRFPLKIAIELATDQYAQKIPPIGSGYGRYYLHP